MTQHGRFAVSLALLLSAVGGFAVTAGAQCMNVVLPNSSPQTQCVCLGADGESCTTVCSNNSSTCADANQDFGLPVDGNSAPFPNCDAVNTAFGIPQPCSAFFVCGGALGAVSDTSLSSSVSCTNAGADCATSVVSAVLARRFCVCPGAMNCSPTPTFTVTNTPTATPTATPSDTPTSTPTDSPTVTPTSTPAQDGAPCTNPADCISGNCVADVCCDTSCDGQDEICNLSIRVGTCTEVCPCTDVASPAPTTSRTTLLIGLGVLMTIAATALWRRRELKHYFWSV